MRSCVSKQLFYTWTDQSFRDFMMQLLTNLEPYQEFAQTVIVSELQEYNEIIFVQKGKLQIGFEINKQKKYCIQQNDRSIIGAYGVTWNYRAQYIYFASTIVQGFFIRKRNWIEILDNGGEVIPVLKKNILLDYLTKIKLKVEIAKKRSIEDFQLRNDHEMI